MKIAIYSGSFNPIHLGHQKLAEYLIDKQLVDEVWFVVSPCNPLKSPKSQLDEYIRLDMVVAAISENPHLKASDVEFTMPIPSYTIDTLHQLTKLYPEHDFALMIGSDNAVIFNQWKNYREILDSYPVYVYPRNGYDFSTAEALYPQMQLLDTPYYDISSTKIREMIQKGEDVSGWLSAEVMEYIRENCLYL
ncbi:MAG: nicotinate (nicotinamide) nucleotide adenylyltransferase [Paludibacter sp.]|nr:nicotinate (nicotinamide) nucleotide adenylyltransferase [Paludibacter sp.]MDD4428238.1 nicotinate (nicotinamide) nucleotide adenylyltransferase [Paludibacter sp.]